MDKSDETSTSSPSRRAVLGGVGVAVGTALAGCSGPVEDDADQSEIEQLEAALAQAQEENETLSDQVEALEDEVATYQRRLDTLNLWGFDEETISQLQELAHTWSDSIVVIDTITEDGLWHMGTGWVYDDGIIATNAHVLQPQRLPERESITAYTVWDREGNRSDGTLLGYTYGQDEIFELREDIGFLSVSEAITQDRKMSQGVSRELSTDDPLLQIGHPYSLDIWTPSTGPFIDQRDPFFASNVPGQPGVSGAPVLDIDGEVVGMTWGGQYVRRPQRDVGDPPEPGEGDVLPAFEEAINGMHSYMHRIHTAADALV